MLPIHRSVRQAAGYEGPTAFHLTRTDRTNSRGFHGFTSVQLLRDAMQRRRLSFKEALNQAIRSGGVCSQAEVIVPDANPGPRPSSSPIRPPWAE
jgi:hypothetical protein